MGQGNRHLLSVHHIPQGCRLHMAQHARANSHSTHAQIFEAAAAAAAAAARANGVLTRVMRKHVTQDTNASNAQW